jgi:hypothetical protein
MRALFLCEGESVPATRFRVVQFLPYFERAGVQCVVRTAYGADYSHKSKRYGGAYKLIKRTERCSLPRMLMSLIGFLSKGQHFLKPPWQSP